MRDSAVHSEEMATEAEAEAETGEIDPFTAKSGVSLFTPWSNYDAFGTPLK